MPSAAQKLINNAKKILKKETSEAFRMVRDSVQKKDIPEYNRAKRLKFNNNDHLELFLLERRIVDNIRDYIEEANYILERKSVN